MIKCEDLWNIFKNENINFFTGVPDSTFKEWMKFLADSHGDNLKNIIACNECEAAAIASGYHFATNNIGVVYLQNSGFGKLVNPLTSLVDPEVYSIPMLLMIGWRGEPGKKDEPQHKKMGRVMIPLLEALEIPYAELPANIDDAAKVISKAKSHSVKNNVPYAIIVKKGLFETYISNTLYNQNFSLTREEAIKQIVDVLGKEDVIVSTTGKTSRELFEYREANLMGHQNDFLTVGSMGCSASIALGIALQKEDKKIIVFDGDGAAIMQEGALTTIGHYAPKNLIHIIFDNAAYESTGGQPTTSSSVDFEKLALANGYSGSRTVNAAKDISSAIKELTRKQGPQMLIVNVKKGSRKDLGRPTTTPLENKEGFMDFLRGI